MRFAWGISGDRKHVPKEGIQPNEGEGVKVHTRAFSQLTRSPSALTGVGYGACIAASRRQGVHPDRQANVSSAGPGCHDIRQLGQPKIS